MDLGDPASIEAFPFDTAEQKKTLLAFSRWAHDRGLPAQTHPFDYFMAQKLMDMHSHVTEGVAGQIKMLQDMVATLNKSVQALRSEVEFLTENRSDGEAENLS